MRALLILIIGAGLGAAGLWYSGYTPQSAPAAAKTTQFTCPMHPQILQDEPGTCPICGMDLVARTDAPSSPETTPPGDTPYTCPMHPQIQEHEAGECPICGMDLVAQSGAASQPAAGSQPATQPAASQPAASRPIHAHESGAYTCPMHPQIQQDEPGTCPICGMDLVQRAPVKEGAEVTIDPVTRQNMGIRIARVTTGQIARAVRTVGTVQVPEDQLTVINLRFAGWIERLRVAQTGAQVKKGSPLFDIYSPELLAAQQEYAVARRTAGPKSALAQAARRRLMLYGAGALARRIDKGKAPLSRYTVRAPAAGFVLHLNVIDGGRVTAGTDLYRIGQLDRVWIEAEVYAHDAPFIQIGAPAQVQFDTGEPRDARVDYLYPTLDQHTRTLRVRLALPNADLALRPGAIATVHIAAQRVVGVPVIPDAAIIHSGTRQLVFVSQSEGRFAPREIQTGLRGDDGQVHVTAGLRVGEQIVTSGQFLIDSESQLQEAILKMRAP